MKLVDKSALVAEIERLKEEKGTFYASDVLYNLEDFINTLETKEVEEEPVSNDLEEAADKHLVEKGYLLTTNNGEHLAEVEAKGLFKAGAQWQKERILNNATEREVKVDVCGYPYIDFTELYDYDKDIPLAKEGDKVKLVIIRENNL